MSQDRQLRLERERAHAKKILENEERYWGWSTAAGKVRHARRAEFLKNTPVDPGAPVLEIGSGTGTFTVSLAERFTQLTSIDIAEDFQAKAKTRCPRVNFRLMDAHQLEFPEGAFSAIVGCSVLHHLDWEAALPGFFSKLKPGGVIRFSEPNLLNPQIFLQKTIPPFKRMMGDSPDEFAFTACQIRGALQRAGFVGIRVRPFEFLHPSTPVRWIPAVERLEAFLSATFLRSFAGSLFIEARKPTSSEVSEARTGAIRQGGA